MKNEIVIGELDGKCKVQYPKKLCNIGDEFTGVFIMDPSVVDKIDSAYLVLYKIEFGDGDENEINLIEKVLKGEPFGKRSYTLLGRFDINHSPRRSGQNGSG